MYSENSLVLELEKAGFESRQTATFCVSVKVPFLLNFSLFEFSQKPEQLHEPHANLCLTQFLRITLLRVLNSCLLMLKGL